MSVRRWHARPAGEGGHGWLIWEDNGGEHHWTIVAGDGAILGRSQGFASHDDAASAAERVRDGAASARFAPATAGAPPVDLKDRRVAAADDSDAERWLDERGRPSTAAVAESPAPS